MEKQKPWQLFIIIAVLVLTIYNILPTIFYYTKPLHSPIDAKRAEAISQEIAERVDSLENESIQWIKAFSKHIGVKPTSVELNKDNPKWITLTFPDTKQAQTFSSLLPNAGALIPFIPAQLGIAQENLNTNSVIVERRVGIHFTPENLKQFFEFSTVMDENNQISPLYRNLTDDRATAIALALADSKNSNIIEAIIAHPNNTNLDEAVVDLAKDIVATDRIFGNKAIAKRIYATYASKRGTLGEAQIQAFLARMESLKTKLDSQHKALSQEILKVKGQQALADPLKEQQASLLEHQSQTLAAASAIVKKNSSDFVPQGEQITPKMIQDRLAKNVSSTSQKLVLTAAHPFIEQLNLNWSEGTISLKLYDDVQAIRNSPDRTELEAYRKERLNQMLINEIARVSRTTDENFLPLNETFVIKLNNLSDSKSFLVLNLAEVASNQTKQLLAQLKSSWFTASPDLSLQNYPILTFKEHKQLPTQEQKLGLVIYAPAMDTRPLPEGLRMNSIYVIAKGLDTISSKYQKAPDSEEAKKFASDIKALRDLMQQNGFIGYSGASFGLADEFQKDFIFEHNNYFGDLLAATREDFHVYGSKKNAVLEFSDVEQRILTENKIDTRIHEDLLKWKEEYQAAQVDLQSNNSIYIPAPNKNVYWDNLKLNMVKYFRGDDRKILRWGLDLSGGKSVRIGLIDQNNQPVTDPADLNQAVNELYVRINKMGVAERSIRIENSNIILEFPGVQGLSASELVKASAMYFYMVNEKFTPTTPIIGTSVNSFLQEVWNEAVVTNRKDLESINEIAWRHLGASEEGDESLRPRSEAAQLLFDNGLRLAGPNDKSKSNSFNDTLSSIGRLRGDDLSSWHQQTHPLVILFHNYALEGSSLQDVQVGFDPSEGNILTFSVKSSYDGRQSGNPREDFYRWTSQFSEDRIAGTPIEKYTQGRGWRLAVVLNDEIINWPVLRAALRDNGTISGRFTQREISQLAADLKAGSLTFTPKILSEYNISPELGKEERQRGIVAAIIGMALVVGIMIGYYRFAGLVASCAVLFTLPIIWAILQNLGAALSLPGIAAIVLTIGMAVDANVLVFERTREEFKISGRIGSALQAGYRKAFSAIFDSNITTLIAAFILIQFDSGPIKGFAITLIIGIIASMFTALFLTRYFFAGWVKNPEHKELKMREWIKGANFDFLSWTKPVVIASVVITLIGSYFFIAQRNTIFGMDFTGGYALTVNLEEKPGVNYRMAATNALLKQGLSHNDFQVRELSRPEQLKIQLGTRMEEAGYPFHNMPEELAKGNFHYPYQKNPRIDWLVNGLEEQGLTIPAAQQETLEQNWTVMSGQLSDAMRNNAIIALTVAMLAILVYITFRFEFKYGIAAIIGIIHDVVLTLAILAILYKLGAPVQIDLQVIGAIMTLIGYSLNDTIIVFDRIREDARLFRRLSFPEVIRHALNVTLSRTLLTSGTTLVALLSLVLMGGSTIFTFSLVMTIGVIIGTLSSLFICAPVLLYFHNREEKTKETRSSNTLAAI